MRAALGLACLLWASPALALGPQFLLTEVSPQLDDVVIDGPRIAVAAHGEVKIYDLIFIVGIEIWLETATLSEPPLPGNVFGTKVALDGDRLVVLENYTPNARAHIFERQSGGAWLKTATLEPPAGTSSTDSFGSAISIDGDFVAIGQKDHAGERGIVHIYRRFNGGVWTLTQSLTSPISTLGLEFFGEKLVLKYGVLAVGAKGESLGSVQNPGRVYIYSNYPLGTFYLEKTLSAPDEDAPGNDFGVALGFDGSDLVVRSAARHYIFRRTLQLQWPYYILEAHWTDGTPWEVQFQGDLDVDNGELLVSTGGAYGVDAALHYALSPGGLPSILGIFFAPAGEERYGKDVDLTDGAAVIGAGDYSALGQVFVLP